MNICVFCSARTVADTYVKAAEEFASLIPKGNHVLVWGGSDNGLMKIVADRVKTAGGKIVGISVKLFENEAREYADEMIITKDLAERKLMMFERSDAFAMLPGGLGTIDEVTTILELKKDQSNRKVVVVVNTDHFYDGLKMQLERMEADGFLKCRVEDLVRFAETPQAAMRYIEGHAN